MTISSYLRHRSANLLAVFVVCAFASTALLAQDEGQKPVTDSPMVDSLEVEEGDLAKKSQNPISDLISLPFQNNTSFSIGPEDRTANTLNIQPVIPVKLSEDWNMITRTIIPLVYAPIVTDSSSGKFGLGDIDFTSWFSPINDSKFIWGVGPAFLFPTSTQEELGTEKFSIGPSAVGLTIRGPWVIGGLVKQFWSVAGDSNRDHINTTIAQPFINYNLKKGWYLVTAPILTADWTADSDDQFVVPLGGGVGKVLKLGKQPINIQAQAFGNVERPAGGPDWSLRFQVQLLFPK